MHAGGVARWLPRACGLLAILLSALALVGWQLDILPLKTVLPGLVAMQPMTASGLALAGAALMLGTGPSPATRAGSLVAAGLVLLIGAQTLAQYLTGADFGTDRLLFPEAVLRQPLPHPFPGRLAPATGIAFALLGAALLLVRAGAARARSAAVALATLGLLIAVTTLLGYLFDVRSLQRIGLFVGIALHTSLALLVLFAGTLALAADVGWPRLLLGRGWGAASARVLLPAVALGPMALVWVAQQGVEAGLYDTGFRLVLTTLGTVVLLAAVTLWSASRLERADAARRRSETALAASEAQLRTIVETVPVGLVMAELPSGRIVGGNRYVETMLRHPVLHSPDIHGYDEWISFHADGSRVDGHEYPLARMVLAGEENPSIEVHYQRGDGTRAWTRIMGRPVRDARGAVVGGVVALVDVDGERRAREALAESEARLKLFIERAPAAIAMFDTGLRYLAASRRFLADHRFPSDLDPASLLGRSHHELFPEIPEHWREIHRRVLAGETLSAEDDPFPRADGRTDWMRWEMTPWRRADGAIGGALLFSEVVTARVEAERAVAEGAARLRLALDAAALGTWRWEVGQGIDGLEWDARCKALFGLPAEAPVDYATWLEALLPEDRPAAEAGVARALDPADPHDDFVCEYRVVHPDGTVVWLAAAGRALFAPGPDAPAGGRRAVRILGTIRDITELRQAEAARRAREERDRYLLGPEERLRAAATAREAVTAACEALGRALGAAFVGVAEMQPDGEHTVVESEWRTDGTPTLLGRHRLMDSGAVRAAPLLAGQVVTVTDATTDSRTAGDAVAQAVYARFGIRASVEAPLMRHGRLRAILFAGHAAPRAWSEADAALALETLERAWQAAERARAEAALAESAQRLRLTLEAGRMGIFSWDLRTDELESDARQHELFGFDSAAGPVSGEAALARVHPEDRPGLQVAMDAAIAAGNGVFQAEFRVRPAEGRWRWLGGYGRAVPDASGRAVRLVGLNFDISERREAQRRLEESHQLLTTIVEGIPDPVFAKDRDGRYRLANAGACAMFGMDRARLLGACDRDLLPPDIAGQIEAADRQVMDGGDTIVLEEEVVDGAQRRRTFLSTKAPLRDRSGSTAGMVGIAFDITARKQAEERLRAAKAEAERANLAKSKFLAAASHDLRQPVQSLTLFLDLLKSRVGDPRAAPLLGSMGQALEALAMLLNGLLDVSKLDAGLVTAQPAAMPLEPLFERLAAEYGPRAEALGLRLRVLRTSAVVRSDPLLLERILRNLIENALRYTERGGVLLGCRRSRDRLRLEVVDTGIGIPPDRLEDVFEEFVQVGNPERDRAKGLGLGLAVVRRLARLLGHELEVRSVPGRGSVFTVQVPLVAMSEPGRLQGSATPANDDAGAVIVVEDDLLVRLGLEAMLADWGHTVLAAGSVEEAIRALEQGLLPRAIIADYRLQAGTTGLDAIRAIHARLGRFVPATIVTGDTAPERLAEAKRGGFRLLHKPVGPTELKQAVIEMLREAQQAS